jgi:hypothetical protein
MRMSMRYLPAVLLTAGLTAVVGPGRAGPREDAAFVLTYEAPAGCPGEATFDADVAEHAGDRTRAAGIRVDVAIEERQKVYVGRLVAFDDSKRRSSRQIEGMTCSEVAHALAFLASLVIELGGRLEPETSPVPGPAPAPPPAVAPPPGPVRAGSLDAMSARRIDVSLILLAGAVGGFGPLVRATGELGVEISARPAILAPALRLVGFGGDSFLEGPGGSAALWFAGARLELCPLRFGNEAIALRPCAGGELGDVHAQGQTAFEPRTLNEPWASVEVTLRAQWFVRKAFFVELSGGPVMPLTRTHYYFEPDQTLYVVPQLTARGAAGLGVTF